MVKVETKVRNDLFKKVGAVVSQFYSSMNEQNDILVNGSIALEAESNVVDDYINIKANLCDKDGSILYVLREYNNVSLKNIGYATFSMQGRVISRDVDVEMLNYIEIYPV